MSINEADVEATRRILTEHAAKFADLPTIQCKPAKTPADHPDWDNTDDPDADMAYIHAMYQALDWFREIVGLTVDYGREVYDSVRLKFNDLGEWTPLAEFRKEFSIMEKIGLNIREDW